MSDGCKRRELYRMERGKRLPRLSRGEQIARAEYHKWLLGTCLPERHTDSEAEAAAIAGWNQTAARMTPKTNVGHKNICEN